MVGFPGETKETMEKTYRLAQELRCDSAQFYPVFVYPGTEAYEWVEKNGYLNAGSFSDWLSEDGYHRPVYSLPNLTAEEMTKFCEDAYRRYHLSFSYIARKLIQGIKEPQEGKRTIINGIHYIGYLIKNEFAIR